SIRATFSCLTRVNIAVHLDSMPFAKSNMTLVNEMVAVTPIYGYGWHEVDKDGVYKHSGLVPVPSPFKFRILEFFFVDGVATVGSGTMLEEGHDFNFWWALLVPLRFDGCVDLSDEGRSYAILI